MEYSLGNKVPMNKLTHANDNFYFSDISERKAAYVCSCNAVSGSASAREDSLQGTVESGGSIFCLVFSLLLLSVHMDCSEILSCDRSCFLFLLSTP